MRNARRATVYLEPELLRALRVKAAKTDETVSDLVNRAVRQTLNQDAEDLEAYRSRAKEPSLDFETVVRRLRRRGRL